MVRALVLLPLLSFGLDQARVSFVCGPDAQSCLDAAGSGRLGLAGVAIMVGYALAIAGLVGRLARGQKPPALLWIVALAGLWAACGGQALLAETLGSAVVLGGGWVPLLAAAVLVAAVLAAALRTLPELIRSLRPAAPRLAARTELALHGATRLTGPALPLAARLARDRAPPATA
jgi:hypothetical protein